MIKTMLLSIIYLLSYLSKGLSKVTINKLPRKNKMNTNFLLEDADSLTIPVFYCVMIETIPNNKT